MDHVSAQTNRGASTSSQYVVQSGVTTSDISHRLRSCLRTMKQLLDCSETTSIAMETQLLKDAWSEEVQRLRTWTVNTEAHQQGSSSLDFRLRDASHLSSQIISLLTELDNLLHTTVDFLHDSKRVGNETEETTLDSDDLFESGRTEYQELYDDVVLRIDCLFDMSLPVRQPAKLDRLLGPRKARLEHFSEHDFQLVVSMLPAASRNLQETLARAMSVRRDVLRYYQDHQQQYTKDIKAVSRDQVGEDREQDRGASVGPATRHVPSSQSGVNVELISRDSNQSLKSLLDSGRQFHIPTPTALYYHKPYECPYCHYLLDIYDPLTFARHVFDDITPFQCLFPQCAQSSNLAPSRSAWLRHLRTDHFEQWSQAYEKPCFMCSERCYSQRRFEKHIARHLEELAILVLQPSELKGKDAGKSGQVNVVPEDPRIGIAPQSQTVAGAVEKQLSNMDRFLTHTDRISMLKLGNEQQDVVDADFIIAEKPAEYVKNVKELSPAEAPPPRHFQDASPWLNAPRMAYGQLLSPPGSARDTPSSPICVGAPPRRLSQDASAAAATYNQMATFQPTWYAGTPLSMQSSPYPVLSESKYPLPASQSTMNAPAGFDPVTWAHFQEFERMQQQRSFERRPPNMAPIYAPAAQSLLNLPGQHLQSQDAQTPLPPDAGYGSPAYSKYNITEQQYANSAGRTRHSYIYGKVTAKGNARVTQGNIKDNNRPMMTVRQHAYGGEAAGDKPNVFGDDATSEAFEDWVKMGRRK